VFQAAGDQLALYIAYNALAWVEEHHMRMDAALDAGERALAHARRAGHAPPGSIGARAGGRFFGTTPVSEVLAWLDEPEQRAGRDPWLNAFRAGVLAMLGRFAEARAILTETRTDLAERGVKLEPALITAFVSVWVELWANNAAVAAELGTQACRQLEDLGEQGYLSTTTAEVARVLSTLDRLDEADAWASRAAAIGASDDAWTQMLSRQARAKVLARRGDYAEAERLAREAVAIGAKTDLLNGQGDANADLADVLLLSGKTDEAKAALAEALERYDRKGNLVMAQRMRDQVARAGQTSGAKIGT
jgi:tetratricopeptide (TPR) repeat protein